MPTASGLGGAAPGDAPTAGERTGVGTTPAQMLYRTVCRHRVPERTVRNCHIAPPHHRAMAMPATRRGASMPAALLEDAALCVVKGIERAFDALEDRVEHGAVAERIKGGARRRDEGA